MAEKKSANSFPLSQVANELNQILSQYFNEYSQELQEKADEVTEEVAQDFAEKLRQVTPRSDDNGTHMADTVKVVTKSERSFGKRTKARYVCYGKWQISHLLEFGWTSKNGQRIDRKPFVRPLFDQNKERYAKMYKEKLQ